jgi:two-component system, chemotaxis family, chemotaxis protein CheY
MYEKYKVLVIDDSPFIFKAVKKALEPQGFQIVDTASNGKIGIELVEKYNPDIVTLDITMPVMDGIETAKVLCQKYPNIKLIMLSAMGDEVLVNEAKEIGIKHFLLKPFKAEGLLNSINSLLEENN